MSESLRLEGLEIALGAQLLVRMTLEVGPGEVLTVMGPSGSGKSTLLAALTGTLAPAFRMTGQVWLGARDLTMLPAQDRSLGILFQDDLLFGHLSVAGNLAFALPQDIGSRAERAKRVDAALQEVDLAGFGPRDPATLSGGQRARVALARCLLSQPQALLLDEPFSRLDLALRDQVRQMVLSHARARGLPVILVTHDPADAQAAGGAVVDPLGQEVGLSKSFPKG